MTAGAGGARPAGSVPPWLRLLGLGVVIAAVGSACTDVSLDPSVPASIEIERLELPALVVGDSVQLRAVVRNLDGDVITDAPVRYLYRQFARDSALVVDSVSGVVVARRIPDGTPVEIAARFESALQILLPVRVTNAPDTVFRTASPVIVGFVPDTGTRGVNENSAAVEVRVQYRDSTGSLQNVGDWLVRFAVVRPANPTNDTTAGVFLVNTESTRPSQLDTTASTGLAARRVRVRPALFPAGGALRDTVEVDVTVERRGEPIGGAPLRIRVPVASPATRGGG